MHPPVALPVALIVAVAAACADVGPAVDACCACLTATTADGAATDDPAASCLADDRAGAQERRCPDAFGGLYAGDDETVALAADGCRAACADACAAVDDDVAFTTPVVTAGTFSSTIAEATAQAAFVVASIAAGGADVPGSVVHVTATIDDGAWTLSLVGVDGPGAYDAAPGAPFAVQSPLHGAGAGAYDVGAFDQRTMTAAFAGTLTGADLADADDDVPVALELAVDFTVNDGESSGWVGLD